MVLQLRGDQPFLPKGVQRFRTFEENQERVRAEVEIEGVRIPFASPRLLWLTKDTLRDRDKVDRAFLAKLLAARGESAEQGASPSLGRPATVSCSKWREHRSARFDLMVSTRLNRPAMGRSVH